MRRSSLFSLVFVMYMALLDAEEINLPDEDFWKEKIIHINTESSPTLEFICLVKNKVRKNFTDDEINSSIIDEIADLNWEINGSLYPDDLYLSTVNSDSINQWLIHQYLKDIEVNFSLDAFLPKESLKISKFLEIQKKNELEELAQINQKFADKNFSKTWKLSEVDEKLINQEKATKKESDFGKFALYLMIGGGVWAIYSVLAPSGGSERGIDKASKIELAKRKRWLVRIFEKGWIDRSTYHFLLKKIESLPEWLGGIQPPDQSAETSEGDENSVALSRRKSGESVVKTNETSCDKTSR